MRALLTGASGFVGGWLTAHLKEMGDEVIALSIDVDILDRDVLDAAVATAAPEVIYHLAGLTHVGKSWDSPAPTFEVNVVGTLNVLEAARKMETPPRVLLVSSSEVYGTGNGTPLSESAPLLPVTPYAASKVAAEYVGVHEFLGRGLEVIRARPFNHVGPGQADAFVVSALARRVAVAERNGDSEIRVGNLSAMRDFTDVRDVVRAYRLLVEKGVPGEVYNVCSGAPIAIGTLFDELVALSTSPIVSVEDPSLFRPVDVPLMSGDCSVLAKLTGWAPLIPRSTTVADVLSAWRTVLDAEAASAEGSA